MLQACAAGSHTVMPPLLSGTTRAMRAALARMTMFEQTFRSGGHLLSTTFTTSPLRMVAMRALEESLNNSWLSFEKGIE